MEGINIRPTLREVTSDIDVRLAVVQMGDEELEQFAGWLSHYLVERRAERAEQEALDNLPDKPGREVVERKKLGKVTYQLEKVRCGKSNCRSCPHGPYWYAYRWNGKRVVSEYVGKQFKLLDIPHHPSGHAGKNLPEDSSNSQR